MGLAVEDAANAKADALGTGAREGGRPLPPVMVVRGFQLRRSPFRSPCRGDRCCPLVGPKEEGGSSREGRSPSPTSTPQRSLKSGPAVGVPASCDPERRRRLAITCSGRSARARSGRNAADRCSPALFLAGRPGDQATGFWGISLQLYLLRSKHNWGIGDFGDLKTFRRVAADLGASVIGLNPLHAMFLDAPESASPYSPASRLFLNVLFYRCHRRCRNSARMNASAQ